MKRIAEPIETTELCHYGCGVVAKYKNGSGNLMCLSNSNSCDAVKKKNSDKLKEAYVNGERVPASQRYNDLPQETKDRMNWNKGNYNADFSLNGKGSHKILLLRERGHQCESCKLMTWLDLPITLELEHIDGNNQNNIKTNLKLLCPNCHSQTETWKGKNSIKLKTRDYISDDDFTIALDNNKNIRQALLSLGLTPKAANYERAYNLLYR